MHFGVWMSCDATVSMEMCSKQTEHFYESVSFVWFYFGKCFEDVSKQCTSQASQFEWAACLIIVTVNLKTKIWPGTFFRKLMNSFGTTLPLPHDGDICFFSSARSFLHIFFMFASATTLLLSLQPHSSKKKNCLLVYVFTFSGRAPKNGPLTTHCRQNMRRTLDKAWCSTCHIENVNCYFYQLLAESHSKHRTHKNGWCFPLDMIYGSHLIAS